MIKDPVELPVGTVEWIESVTAESVTSLHRHVARREAWSQIVLIKNPTFYESIELAPRGEVGHGAYCVKPKLSKLWLQLMCRPKK